MNDTEIQADADAAVSLSRSHPNAPAIDLLENLLRGMRGLQFPAPADVSHPQAGPRCGLGKLIAATFDARMTPREWLDLTGGRADRRLVAALPEVWRTEVSTTR